MNHQSSAREALIAELIGDVARLLDRVEALMPALNESRQALVDAGAELAGQLEGLENQMAAIMETARTQVVKHIVNRTADAARQSQELQSRAMAEAARELFKTEAERALQRLVASLQRLSQRTEHPWERWLTHAATAALASAATWTLTVWFGLK